jgi:dipeptidyl aminopeptidase/acylaminoacyl peptidase
MKTSPRLWISAIIAHGLTTAASFAAVNIEEQVVGPAYDASTNYTLSPKGLHLATVHAKGSRFAVTVDGMEGPAYDEILMTAVNYTSGRSDGFSPFGGETAPVVFSPDGKRHAYTARIAKEVMVIADGKEIFRTAHVPNEPPVGTLSFSPDGKRVLFVTRATDAAKEVLRDLASGDRLTRTTAARLMIDGKPASPPYVPTQMAFPVFNADGSRWALLGGRPGSSGTGFLMVDGKDAGDTGNVEQYAATELIAPPDGQSRTINYALPRFTPDGRRLVSLRIDPQTRSGQLLVDGKPILTASETINGFFISSQGDIAAIAKDRDGKRRLFINGKAMAGTDHAYHVIFSPDGKRWSAACGELPSNISPAPGAGIHATTAWAIVDGKKQLDYTKISELTFTPDSSRCVYMAEVFTSGVPSKKLVVINGEEHAAQANSKLMFSKNGNRVAYRAEVPGMRKEQIYLDGKAVSEAYAAQSLTFSPDGARHAYFASEGPTGSTLMINGEAIAKAGGGGAPILFSDDGQHVATFASPPKGGGGATICVDGEFLPVPKTLQNPSVVGFTSDNKSLILGGNEGGPQGGNTRSYYINGERVAQFSPMAVSSFSGVGQPKPWETQPDGSVIFIGAEVTGTYGGVMKRIKATPAVETSIATWIADVKSAKEKEIADAADKKKKAEADRLAAIEAKAKAKADADEKRAKDRADAAAKKAEADAARKAKKTTR